MAAPQNTPKPGAELRLPDLIELAPDGFFLTDRSGRYIEVNDAGCQLFKSSREEILGKPVFDFISVEDATTVRQTLPALQRGLIQRIEWTLHRPDGTALCIEAHIRGLPDGTCQSIVRDISERRQRELERQREIEALDQLQKLTTLFLSDQQDDAILATILDAAIAIAEADFGTVQAVEPGSGVLRIVAHRGLPAWWVERWERVPAGKGAWGAALALRCRVIVEDIESDPSFAGTDCLDVHRRAGIRAVHSTPLLGRSGELLGIISAHYKTPRRPPDYMLRLLDLLARQTADIFEHRRIERSLRRAEARASGLLSISADAVISLDENQHITEWNRGAEQVFGYSQAEALGAPLDMLIPKSDRAVHMEYVKRFISESGGGRRVVKGAASGLRKSGEIFPIEATLSHLEVSGERIFTIAVRDVSEQRREQEAQRLLADLGGALASLETEDALPRIARLAVERLADLAVIYSERDGEMHRVAAACREPEKAWAAEYITNLPGSSNPKHPVWRVFSDNASYLEAVRPERYEEMAESPEHLHALQAVAPRGALIVPLCVAHRCRGALGLYSSTRSFDAQDVRLVEEVAHRCALYIENARLLAAEKRATRARDEVLGIVAHDLRNPLNVINMQLQLLRRGAPEGRWQAPAEAIRSSMLRMNRLIQDLLDVAALEAGVLSIEWAPIEPGKLIADVVAAQGPLLADSSIELRVEVAEGLSAVRGDYGRLLQVFENLLGNAVKFTPAGGQVTLGATEHQAELHFRVTDTGPGIPAEQLPRLFDRFWQADPGERRGIGLGLAIVKGIVQAHGGRIWVESVVGRGTSFIFAIPSIYHGFAGS